MAFHFSLAGLLCLRQGVEHNCELALITAQQRVNSIAQQITDIDSTLAAWHRHRADSLRERNSASELHFQTACVDAMQTHRTALCRQLEDAVEFRDQRAAAYREARRQREILDLLCEEEWQRYRRAQTRREQQAADDLYLLLHHSPDRG